MEFGKCEIVYAMADLVPGDTTRCAECFVLIVQQIAAVLKRATSLHGHVAGYLPHPRLVRVNGDAGHSNRAALEMAPLAMPIPIRVDAVMHPVREPFDLTPSIASANRHRALLLTVARADKRAQDIHALNKAR